MWPGNCIMQPTGPHPPWQPWVAGTSSLRVSTCGPRAEVPSTARGAGNTTACQKSRPDVLGVAEPSPFLIWVTSLLPQLWEGPVRRLWSAGTSQVSSVRTPCVSVFWRWGIISGTAANCPASCDWCQGGVVVPVLVCLCMQARAGPRTGRARLSILSRLGSVA